MHSHCVGSLILHGFCDMHYHFVGSWNSFKLHSQIVEFLPLFACVRACGMLGFFL